MGWWWLGPYRGTLLRGWGISKAFSGRSCGVGRTIGNFGHPKHLVTSSHSVFAKIKTQEALITHTEIPCSVMEFQRQSLSWRCNLPQTDGQTSPGMCQVGKSNSRDHNQSPKPLRHRLNFPQSSRGVVVDTQWKDLEKYAWQTEVNTVWSHFNAGENEVTWWLTWWL